MSDLEYWDIFFYTLKLRLGQNWAEFKHKTTYIFGIFWSLQNTRPILPYPPTSSEESVMYKLICCYKRCYNNLFYKHTEANKPPEKPTIVLTQRIRLIFHICFDFCKHFLYEVHNFDFVILCFSKKQLGCKSFLGFLFLHCMF